MIINNNPYYRYELYFDKHIRIRIGQSFHSVGLVGPPPSVKIGDPRSDLCAGYVQLIIDGDLNQQVIFIHMLLTLLGLRLAIVSQSTQIM